jgi:hypothetical protein
LTFASASFGDLGELPCLVLEQNGYHFALLELDAVGFQGLSRRLDLVGQKTNLHVTVDRQPDDGFEVEPVAGKAPSTRASSPGR